MTYGTECDHVDRTGIKIRISEKRRSTVSAMISDFRIQTVIERIEVDDRVIRIIGDRHVLEQAATGRAVTAGEFADVHQSGAPERRRSAIKKTLINQAQISLAATALLPRYVTTNNRGADVNPKTQG